jgi:ATP-dependent DNA ligase
VYEEKYDGWRMLAVKEEGRVKLISRNERDHTRRFPERAVILLALPLSGCYDRISPEGDEPPS